MDSNDISRLSGSNEKTKELIAVKNELLELKQKSLIEFRYSLAHIKEAAPTSPSAIQFARERFAFIKELCAEKCFRSDIDVLTHEVKALDLNSDDIQFDVYSDTSLWFPEEASRATKFSNDEIVNWLNEEISVFPDRASRRKAKARLLTQGGKLIKKNLQAEFPVNESEAEKFAKKILSGEGGEVLELLNSSFQRIELLADWYTKRWDIVLPFSSDLRDIGNNLSQDINKFSKYLQNECSKFEMEGIEKNQIKKFQKEIVNNFFGDIS